MPEPRENPGYLRQLSADVEEFREAFSRFMELHVVNTHLARGTAPAAWRRADADEQEIERRTRFVSKASGKASAAAALTGTWVGVQGIGPINPIAAWATVTKPKPLLEPSDVLEACDQIVGRLESLILQAEADAPPASGAAALHPLVWDAARKLWKAGDYRRAVGAAAEALIGQVKTRIGRNDVDETGLWQQAFALSAPEPGKPRLRWPGDPKDRHVSTMRSGLLQFAPGVQMVIRNPAIHHAVELSEQVALEQLCVLSALARFVDGCVLDEAP